MEASYNAPQEVMSDMRARIGKLPSTGIATIYWLLKIIGVKKLHLVGFDSFQKDRSKRHHYWDPTIYKMPTEHDPDKEKAIIIHWAQVGRVAMLT